MHHTIRDVSQAFACLLLLACATGVSADEDQSAQIRRIAPPLDGEIVSIFIPQSRPERLHAATANHLFLFDGDASAWQTLCAIPNDSSKILQVAGYAHSSKAIYLAHSTGIMVSEDRGETWTSSNIPDFADASSSFVSISVDPSDRRRAALITSHNAWRTSNFGQSWKPMPLPSRGAKVNDAAFVGEERPQLFVATARGLFWSSDWGQRWTESNHSESVPRLLAATPTVLAAMYDGAPTTFLLYDARRTGYQLEVSSSSSEAPDSIALNAGTRSAVWGSRDKNLFVYGLAPQEASIVQLREGNSKIENLTPDPETPDTLYWSEGPQVWKLDHGFTQLSSHAFITRSDFVPAAATLAATIETPAKEDTAEDVVDSLLASEPSLSAAVGAAIQFADLDLSESDRWKKKVRRRNALPTVTLRGGVRQDGLRKSAIVMNTDRNGIRSPDDLILSEDVRYLNEFGIGFQWNLPSLVFDREQTRVSEDRRRKADARNGLIRLVTKTYYERIEFLAERLLAKKKGDVNDRVSLALQIREATDLLNQLCGDQIFDYGGSR